MKAFSQIPPTRKKLLIVSLLVFFVGILILNYLAGFSMISVEVSGGANTTKIVVTDDMGETIHESSGTSTSFRTRNSGFLRIQASLDDRSSLAAAKGTGFFRKTSVKIELIPQKEREFIGENPNSCMEYIDILYTYPCRGRLSDLSLHRPSTSTQPGSVIKPYDNFKGYNIVNTVSYDGRIIALVSRENEENRNEMLYFLTEINEKPLEKFYSVGSAVLPRKINMTKYKDGVVVFDSQLDSLSYYKNINAKAENFTVNIPNSRDVVFNSLDASESSLLIKFEEPDEDTATDPEPEIPVYPTTKSEIYVWKDGLIFAKKQFSLGSIRARFCGDNNVCVLSSEALVVYNENLSKITSSMNGVDLFASLGGKNIISRDNSIYLIDAETTSGSLLYRPKGYDFCGLNSYDTFVIICQVDPDGVKTAMRITPTPLSSNKIEQDVLEIKKSKSVKKVSVYKNTVYIVPELGKSVYDPSVQGYAFSNDIVESAGKEINTIIERLELRENGYTVINTYAR